MNQKLKFKARLLDLVITKSNVTRLAEIITVRAVKTLAIHSYGKLEYLYKNLLIDVYERDLPAHTFSDGYNLVQECALFLWRHNGQALNTYYGKDKFEKPMNILYVCYHLMDRYLEQGIVATSTAKRLNELEERKTALERQIIIEQSKQAKKLNMEEKEYMIELIIA